MNLGIIFKCNDAAEACNKSQYKESSLSDRILLRMHKWICKVCKKNSAENSKLTEIIEKADLKTLPEEKKHKLREVIQQEISK